MVLYRLLLLHFWKLANMQKFENLDIRKIRVIQVYKEKKLAFAEDEFMAKVIFNVCTNSITHELCFSDPYHNQMLKEYILKIYDLGNILKCYLIVLSKKTITTRNRSIALSS